MFANNACCGRSSGEKNGYKREERGHKGDVLGQPSHVYIDFLLSFVFLLFASFFFRCSFFFLLIVKLVW